MEDRKGLIKEFEEALRLLQESDELLIMQPDGANIVLTRKDREKIQKFIDHMKQLDAQLN